MPVSHKRPRRNQDDSLKLLVEFLNFNFLKAAENPQKGIPAALLSIVTDNWDKKWTEEMGELQSEVSEDLLRLISAGAISKRPSQKDIASALTKLNSIGVRAHWEISLATWSHGSGGRSESIITPIFKDSETARERIYGIIFKACVDGSVALLRRCKRCPRFFIRRRKRVFCGAACIKQYAREHDPSRVKTWRRARNRSQKRKSELKPAKGIESQLAEALGTTDSAEQKESLVQQMSAPDFLKRLPGGPNERMNRQDSLLKACRAAASVADFLDRCDPSTRRIIEQVLTTSTPIKAKIKGFDFP